MQKIAAAMDMSGNLEEGHNTFLAVVIGIEEHIRSVIKSTGYDYIHMRAMGRRDQERVAGSLNLDRMKCITLCVKTSETHLVDRIVNAKKMKKGHIVRGRIVRAYNRLVFAEIRHVLEDFSIKHGLPLQDVAFECDSDCIGFAKDVGLRYIHIKPGSRSPAHMAADYIAWSNNKRKKPDGTIEVDVTESAGSRLANNFLR